MNAQITSYEQFSSSENSFFIFLRYTPYGSRGENFAGFATDVGELHLEQSSLIEYAPHTGHLRIFIFRCLQACGETLHDPCVS